MTLLITEVTWNLSDFLLEDLTVVQMRSVQVLIPFLGPEILSETDMFTNYQRRNTT
ncbi:hypothetical protein DPMN_035121 [Dreissena polymorpha]|uniref:Uncharacterized protein n=1 Tax=Dreissena polymorpha TaxID=45954 RepID=A0A9D4RKB0_DREPO|nr:hypothetical protein DPMN_035121 [Dreissena polymorpha]